MKKLLLLFTAMLMAVGVTKAQDSPLYVADAETTLDEDYAALYDGHFPEMKGMKAEVYEGYVIIRSVAGVEGYDMMVEFDADDNVLSITPIKDGVEDEPVSNGYCYIYTGLEGDNSCLSAYVAPEYCYAGVDPEDNSGYVFLTAYDVASNYIYYQLEWPVVEESLPEGCLYQAVGETGSAEGWGTTYFPSIRDIKVEAYEGYVIIRSWAGVEGYDMMVEIGEDDAVLSVTSIVNGEEGEPATKEYFKVPTGRDDFDYINIYLASNYCYGGLYEDESGYILLGCYVGDDWTYYYLAWPQGEEGTQEEWVNPFEGEATFLYSAVAKTSSIAEEDPEAEDAWGESVFPAVENIKVDVYDKYIYIHALGGVEGYDAKVAYNAEEEVPSIISVTNGEESEPCKSHIYLYTGREDFVTIQAYPSYSYAASYDDKSGYVTLSAYIYKSDDTSDWNYYNISWDADDAPDAISDAAAGTTADAPAYNLAGQKVADGYKGIVVKDGKKTLVK